jgi:hypothetical protein
MANINDRLRSMAGRPGANAAPEDKPVNPVDPADVLERVEEALDVLTASTDSLRELSVDLRRALDAEGQGGAPARSA